MTEKHVEDCNYHSYQLLFFSDCRTFWAYKSLFFNACLRNNILNLCSLTIFKYYISFKITVHRQKSFANVYENKYKIIRSSDKSKTDEHI